MISVDAPDLAGAGVLSGGGSAMTRALLRHGPVPSEPPAELGGLVAPVRDGDGNVCDWRLDVAKLLLHHDAHVHDLRNAFTDWRAAFVTEAALGDVATVRAFLHWASPRAEISALNVLSQPGAVLGPETAKRAAWETHEVGSLCKARAEQGLGITTPSRPGLVRGFVVGYQPLVVLADGPAQVAATRAGFEVTEVDADDAEEPLQMLVHGWTVDAEGVTVVGDDGPVHLGTALAGRLLAQLAPGVEQACAGPAPLASIFGDLLHHLPEIAMLAARQELPLHITTD